MWNDQTRPYRDDVQTWTDVPSEIIRDDWDRIGWYYRGFYRVAGYSEVIDKGPKFPNGIPSHLLNKSPRKQMIYNGDETPNPGQSLLEPPEDC